MPGDGSIDTVAVKASKREREVRHQRKEDEDCGHARSGADEVAAARDLSFLAGLLTAPGSCLFGLVGLCHILGSRSSASSNRRSAISNQRSAINAAISALVSKSFPKHPRRGQSGRRTSAASTPPLRRAAPSRADS